MRSQIAEGACIEVAGLVIYGLSARYDAGPFVHFVIGGLTLAGILFIFRQRATPQKLRDMVVLAAVLSLVFVAAFYALAFTIFRGWAKDSEPLSMATLRGISVLGLLSFLALLVLAAASKFILPAKQS